MNKNWKTTTRIPRKSAMTFVLEAGDLSLETETRRPFPSFEAAKAQADLEAPLIAKEFGEDIAAWLDIGGGVWQLGGVGDNPHYWIIRKV